MTKESFSKFLDECYEKFEERNSNDSGVKEEEKFAKFVKEFSSEYVKIKKEKTKEKEHKKEIKEF